MPYQVIPSQSFVIHYAVDYLVKETAGDHDVSYVNMIVVFIFSTEGRFVKVVFGVFAVLVFR